MTSLLSILCSVLSFSALLLSCESGELVAVKDAIFATKARDVVALGLFESKSDSHFKDFNAVSKSFPEDAVGFEYSFSEEIHERYSEEIASKGGLPAIIVFRNFDEDGIHKRGKRVKFVFDSENEGLEFTKDSIMEFVFRATLPPVCEMPTDSNESSRRTRLALTSAYPKLILLSRSGSGDSDLEDEFLEVAKSVHDRSVALRVIVDVNNEDALAQSSHLFESVFEPNRSRSVIDTLRSGRSIFVAWDPASGQRTELESPQVEVLKTTTSEFLDKTPSRYPLILTHKEKSKKKKANKKKSSKPKDDL